MARRWKWYHRVLVNETLREGLRLAVFAALMGGGFTFGTLLAWNIIAKPNIEIICSFNGSSAVPQPWSGEL